VTDPMEEAARRIAELGHGALLRRLRPAFDHAAVTYASSITIRRDELEGMLAEAAQRADAVLWRRALASVAMDELDIGLGAALEHRAVIRAQEIVGAPALDRAVFSAAPDSAAEPEAPPESGSPPPFRPEPEALSGPEAPIEVELTPPDQPQDLTPQAIRLAAVHLDGIENLPRGGKNLELRLSDAGFDVVDAEGGDVIGRLRWDEIEALELPSAQSARGRRRRRTRTQLVVRTDRGEASFEILGVTDEELREHLAPILAKVRRAPSAR
jgi:hypothetical protein